MSKYFDVMFRRFLDAFQNGITKPDIRLFKRKEPFYPDLTFSKVNKKTIVPYDAPSLSLFIRNHQEPYTATGRETLRNLSEESGKRAAKFEAAAEEAEANGDTERAERNRKSAKVCRIMEETFKEEMEDVVDYMAWSDKTTDETYPKSGSGSGSTSTSK